MLTPLGYALERELVRLAGQRQFSPSLPDDERFVGFVSKAQKLVPDNHAGMDGIFVRDRVNERTEFIAASEFAQGNRGLRDTGVQP